MGYVVTPQHVTGNINMIWKSKVLVFVSNVFTGCMEQHLYASHAETSSEEVWRVKETMQWSVSEIHFHSALLTSLQEMNASKLSFVLKYQTYHFFC